MNTCARVRLHCFHTAQRRSSALSNYGPKTGSAGKRTVPGEGGMRRFAGGLTGDGGRVVDKDGNATDACALEGAAEPDEATDAATTGPERCLF